jgi:lysophospholipase L1-like esterase
MNWYEDEIRRLEKEKTQLRYTPELFFYGSSSFTLWNTLSSDFQDFKPANLGFGGSTLASCVWFFDRVFSSYFPKAIVVYGGDNDLGDGRHAEEVFIFFQQLKAKIKAAYGPIPCGYISIKPSISRWNIIDRIKYTNRIIEESIKREESNWHFIDIYKDMTDEKGLPKNKFFQADGLHLSKEGYELWKQILLRHFSKMMHS